MARVFATPRRYFDVQFFAAKEWHTANFDSAQTEREARENLKDVARCFEGTNINRFRILECTTTREVIDIENL